MPMVDGWNGNITEGCVTCGFAEGKGHAPHCSHWRPAPKPTCPKCNELARLLIECRDALPAITIASARLRRIDLTLADRIEVALRPWEVPDGTPGAI